MKIEITYPPKKRRLLEQREIIRIAKWPFLFAAYICPIINLVTGGAAWSLIVLWSLWMVWSLVLAPDMVEYNRISQVIKLVTDASILLILIELLLVGGWAIEVVPIVCFSGLAVVGVLFFADLDRQKQNMLPMLLFIAASLVCSLIGLACWREESRWALAVMGAFAAALLIACFSVISGDMVREFKKRFHV